MTDRPPTEGLWEETNAKDESPDLGDLDSLVSLARSSEDHEACRVVVAREDFRVVIVVSGAPETSASFRIEVLLRILAKDSRPKLSDLERANKILEALAGRGYSLSHNDSCWVTCERELADSEIRKECLAVVEIVQSKTGLVT